jgi:hypothetical protein
MGVRRKCPDCRKFFVGGPRTQRCEPCRQARKGAQNKLAKERFLAKETAPTRKFKAEQVKRKAFFKRFGISLTEFMTLLERQKGLCDCCGVMMNPPTSRPTTEQSARRFLPIWLRDGSNSHGYWFTPRKGLMKSDVFSTLVCLKCYKRLRRMEDLRANRIYGAYYARWGLKYGELRSSPRGSIKRKIHRPSKD